MDPKQVLKKSSLFREFNPLELLKLTEICRRLFLPKAGVIISEGADFEADSALYVMVTGLAKVAVPMGEGKELVLAFMSPGDHFGEMSFLDQHPRSADVVAMEDTELLVMEQEALEELLAGDREMGLKFYRSMSKVLAKRLREANARMSGRRVDPRR